MAKLHGAKKAAFLRRMAAGRAKAAGRSIHRTVKRRVKRRVSRTIRKTIKRVSRRAPMARRRRTASKSRGLKSKIPLINNPLFKKAAIGIGAATLAATVVSFVAPSIAQNPIFKPAIAFLTGDVIGLGAQVISSGGLGALTGGSSGTSSGAGFA